MSGRVKAAVNQGVPEPGISVEQERALSDALFSSIGQGAIVTDSLGRVSHINQAALQILGFDQEDLLGKWYPDALVAEDESGQRLEYIDRPIAEVFITGQSVFRKLYYLRKDGSRVAVALTVSPVLLEGKPIGAIQVFRDITDEVRLNRAKDEFISLASHQLRTPATSVKQYLGMLLDGYTGELTKQQKKFLMVAYQNNERQLRIINDLLKVAAADAGIVALNKERTDLIPIINHIIEDQAAKFATKNQQIDFRHQQKRLYINVDKDTFRMALENLIDNAHKYTHPDKKIEISAAKTGQEVSIAVKDQGTGIPQGDFKKLFQKFSRLNNPLSITSGGTGLGLYWTRQIIELHGGKVSVKSKVGKGTTFTVTLKTKSKV